jgi:hypothetical protein
VEISNVSDYLFAINNDANVAYNTQAPSGKLYARDLKFDLPAGFQRTNVFLKAEFADTLDPPLDWDSSSNPCSPVGGPSCTQWSRSGWNPSYIKLGDPAVVPLQDESPKRITALRFPIITQSDADTYSRLAGKHTTISTFVGDSGGNIYPPSYFEDGGDHDNTQHVYYSSENIHIGNSAVPGSTITVHGQVIFFTTNTIFIDANIVSAPSSEIPPGHDHPSSSTAHQAILITGPGHDIQITNNFWVMGGTEKQKLTIEALLFATSGRITCLPTSDPTIPVGQPRAVDMSLDFKGSIIAGQIGDLSSSFADGSLLVPRNYSYMDTLRTHPPPYLPAFVVTYNEFQELVNTPNIY